MNFLDGWGIEMATNNKKEQFKKLQQEKERINRQLAQLDPPTTLKPRITFRITSDDEHHILSQQSPGQDPSKTIKKALRRASKFQQLKTQKITDITSDIAFFGITAEDLDFDIQNKINERIRLAFADLWRDAKQTRQGQLNKLIKKHKEKHT